MWPRFLVLIFAAALSSLSGLSCARTPPARTGPGGVEDYRSIPIAAVSAEGGSHALSELLGTRPALVSFWAPWCEPCLKELPELDQLAQTVGPCGGTVLGVAVGENPQSIAKFVRARPLSFPQFTDEQFRLADALGQRRVPATIVLDSDQQIVYVGSALDGRATGALATALGEAAGGAPCPSRTTAGGRAAQ
jgi:thiol-disulfide isomerase/thioredoxin